jgi:DNA modification methylase
MSRGRLAHVSTGEGGMIRILPGDCRDVLPTLADASAQCCVTSPPYFGLRDYGVAGQLGLEPSPDAYVAELVAVFHEVRRVLRDDGVLFLNLGDSYATTPTGSYGSKSGLNGAQTSEKYKQTIREQYTKRVNTISGDLKPKDLIGIPWMVAFALRADGWWLRSDIIWAKPNPMPESVTDRPTSAHEHVFLLAKSARYFWDADAIAEESIRAGDFPGGQGGYQDPAIGHYKAGLIANGQKPVAATRNIRNVWTIPTQSYSGAHFATFPPALAERCIKAGSRPGDTILDPFSGAGTTAMVADRLGRDAIGIELNPAYSAMAHKRVVDDCPLFAEVAAQ